MNFETCNYWEIRCRNLNTVIGEHGSIKRIAVIGFVVGFCVRDCSGNPFCPYRKKIGTESPLERPKIPFSRKLDYNLIEPVSCFKDISASFASN